MGKYVIAYDIGTTGVKTCLFEIDKTIELKAAVSHGYELYILEDGGAEQDFNEWWQAMAETTNDIFSSDEVKALGVTPNDIEGISFCSQMQGLVCLDKDCNVIRRPMSYMDQRAKEEIKKGIANGIQIAGANIFKLLPYLYLTGAVSCSVKDPIWKYKWIEAHEPENFKKIYKIVDVKESLIAKMTGRIIMTPDSAFGQLLYDTRKGHEGWSKFVCKMVGVNPDHLAEIVKSTDVVGGLTEAAAKDLGLVPGIPVFGGGGDASLIGVGAGAVLPGDTHIYSGTSGWVGTVVEKQTVDTGAMIAAIVGAQEGKFNYFAEHETSGKCLEWVKNHLALDEIDIYLEKKDVTESPENFEEAYTSLYDYLSKVMAETPAGSNGVVFTPWLHGNRCPFEDPNAAGMFFNINIETGKRSLIRSVVEGVCFQNRWMYEQEAKKVQVSDTVRFVGGGALSDVTCQILADVLQKKVETVDSPQNVGAVGAAAVIGVGIGAISNLEAVKDFIPASKTFEPNPENKEVYDKNFEVFKTLYKNNKKAFKALNAC
ncbi:MAG: FGGY-family carbohydrate kinase [Oscillospiraceae bacterium]|nr:FGGY-family carbohydrate kinase [Candidatus Limimonas coprohippi]